MTFEPLPLFIGGLPGGPELLVVLLIVVLLFGAQKLPKLARSSGEAMGEFQKGREEVEAELEDLRTDAPDTQRDGAAEATRASAETDPE